MQKTLQPADWERPKGYANGIAASGSETIYTGGMIGWDGNCQFQSTDFVDQIRTTLENILAVLAEADAGPQHLVRMTWYITDKQEYKTRQREIGETYRAVIGRYFPAMAVVEVSSLMEDEAMVEIEAIAVK